MYIINDFQLQSVQSTTYLFNDTKAAKIPNEVICNVLKHLKAQKKMEISEEGLNGLAAEFNVSCDQLKNLLLNQLDILRPQAHRKFQKIYLNVGDPLICDLLKDTFQTHYHVEIVPENFANYEKSSLVIFFQNNYSSKAFQNIYQHLPDDVYLITSGILHNILVIDNLYFNHSGLPTHVSNLHQLMAFLSSNLSATKDNWLLFYRSLVKNKVDVFPEPTVNACQKGFIAYTLFQFASQYTQFFKMQTPLDKVGWFWHVDLTNFNVHEEVAVHSAFSEYDMKLDLNQVQQMDVV